MTRNRQDGLYLLLVGAAILVVVGAAMHFMATNSMKDLRGIYNATQVVLEHRDPYRANIETGVDRGLGEINSPNPGAPNHIAPLFVYLPSSIIWILPFAVLPWGPAQLLWTILFTVSIVLAAFLTWEVGAKYAPRLSGGLICILLANCIVVFHNGNPAGIAVGICVIGVWCIINDRFVPAGILCLAVSLAIKPHDSGLVWLCFLLAGGNLRRRSLQTFAVTILLSIPAFFWIWQVAPHWIPEVRSNLSEMSSRGGLTDPGPTGVFNLGAEPIIDLQGSVSFLRDDPGVYNPISYAICATLLLIWSIAMLRSKSSRDNIWFALAFAAATTILLGYHRPYDAKLLLLTVPACAILWSEGGNARWLALVMSTLGMVFTAEIPLAVIGILAGKMPVDNQGLAEKLLTVVITRPASPILLAMAIFYLWAYMTRTERSRSATGRESTSFSVVAPNAS